MNSEVRPAARAPSRDIWRHVADAVVPNVAFLVFYETVGVSEGVVAAVVAGLVLVVLRLARGHKLTVVFAAFGVVLLHVATVIATGEGRDYFLPWLVLNVALTLVFTGSILIGRPVSMRLKRFGGMTADLSRHTRVTALWAGLFGLHLLVGLPLYSADMVVALGVTKFVLGPPAVLLLGFLSWRLLTRATTADPVVVS